jgi:hypothetical protein
MRFAAGHLCEAIAWTSFCSRTLINGPSYRASSIHKMCRVPCSMGHDGDFHTPSDLGSGSSHKDSAWSYGVFATSKRPNCCMDATVGVAAMDNCFDSEFCRMIANRHERDHAAEKASEGSAICPSTGPKVHIIILGVSTAPSGNSR